MKTILVTGGAGFVGSHLCDYLLQKGERVIALDSLVTGRERNIEEASKNKNFSFIKHDIILPWYSDTHIDEIYNLACPASPVQYRSNPIHTVKTNTIGMINMLGLAKKHNAQLLQASTSEVYGDPLEHPQKESYNGNVCPTGPRACYDEGKRAAETLCMDYHREHGVAVHIARIFNTYGARMSEDDGRVVSNFIVQALTQKPLTIYGDGTQTRSFCYVDDLVCGLYLLMQSDEVMPVNLGNSNERTIIDIANHIIELTSSKSKIVYKKLPENDPKKRNPDIARAKKILGWQPRVDLRDGLKKTIEYFKSIVGKGKE